MRPHKKTVSNEELIAAGIQVEHHFASGLYSKEMHVPAGMEIGKHVHDFDHFSMLMSGSVDLDVDGEKSVHHAPALLTIRAGQLHVITALTDVVWHCIHATLETDVSEVDAALTREAV